MAVMTIKGKANGRSKFSAQLPNFGIPSTLVEIGGSADTSNLSIRFKGKELANGDLEITEIDTSGLVTMTTSPVLTLGYMGGSEQVHVSDRAHLDDPLRITSQYQSVNYTDPNLEIIGIGGKVIASGRISFKVEVTDNSITVTGSGEGAGVDPNVGGSIRNANMTLSLTRVQ